MPTASLNKNPQHVANIGYSGFDMSQEVDFTSSVAQLLPVYYDILMPGDKVDCRAIIKTRTAPIETAAQVSITEHVEWFFVPLEQIYSAFGNFFYGIEDFDSALFHPYASSAKSIDGLPYTNLYGAMGDDAYQATKGSIDEVGFNHAAGYFRLLDHFGIPISNNIATPFDANLGTFPLSPLFFCAYQKIYSDFYRLSDRVSNEPSTYNLDDFIYSGTRTINPGTFALRFGQLRYRPWKKDFFKNTQVSPLFGSQSINAQPSTVGLINEVNNWLSGLSKVQTGIPQTSAAMPDGGSLSNDNQNPTQPYMRSVRNNNNPSYTGVSDIFASMNPANIRQLFATEKLLEITRRAGKHYDAQTLAHFGVKVPQGVDGEVIYLGEQSTQIQIGDVVSTSETTGAPLGEIAGKGYAYGSGDSCKFEAKCHGILMAIFSAEPQAKYDQVGLDKLMSLIERTDFVIPEYENLGMQPIFGYQSVLTDTPTQNSQVLGWQYRYQEFKMKYDRVFAGFCDGQTLRHWVNSVPSYLLTPSSYYIHPDSLNDVMLYDFALNVDTTKPVDDFIHDEIFAADPLYNFLYMDVKKSSKMSVYGIPSL